MQKGVVMSRKAKQIILVVFDLLAIVFSSILSYLFLNIYVSLLPKDFWLAVLLTYIFYMVIANYFQVYSKINRYVNIEETLLHILSLTMGFFLTSVFGVLFLGAVSGRFMVLSYLFSVVIIPGSRILWQTLVEHYEKKKELALKGLIRKKIRTIIVGAGQGGSLFIENLKRYNSEVELIGIVDDAPSKQNVFLYGVPVIGTVSDIPKLIVEHDVEQITIAIPSLKADDLERIVESCSQTDVKINQMPSVEKVISGKYQVNKFKKVDVVDLLGREEVKLDIGKIGNQLADKVVLITGAGGSIGSEIARQIMRFTPKRVLLLGNGEHSIYLIHSELTGNQSKTELIPLIGDVQDRKRMFDIMEEYRPDLVYHAAAHKHVPLMEYNPKEAVKNNVYGTKNVAEAAKEHNVETFVMVSTDKAVNPPNVMGSTKRIAEMIVTGLNEVGKTSFVAVRFGNVLGSRGSVIPHFTKQIEKGGPVTITDYRMTRYFMTIPEASRLVLQAGALAKGGEIFVLDMGEPVKIVDLAKKMIRLSGHTEHEIKIVEAGIRPGEKLYEELLTPEEGKLQQVHEKIFVGKVNKVPTEKVLQFLEDLKLCTKKELKEKLVEFANNGFEEDEEKVIEHIMELEESPLQEIEQAFRVRLSD